MLWLFRRQRQHITLKQANGKWMDIEGVGGMVLVAGRGVGGDGDEGGGIGGGDGNGEGDSKGGSEGGGEGDDEGATTRDGDAGKVGGAGGTDVGDVSSRINGTGDNTGGKAVGGV
jgi:hypothetical protein